MKTWLVVYQKRNGHNTMEVVCNNHLARIYREIEKIGLKVVNTEEPVPGIGWNDKQYSFWQQYQSTNSPALWCRNLHKNEN